eukprot:284096_1
MKPLTSITKEYTIPMQYSFMFTSKPFGVAFKNKNMRGAFTKTDIFVDDVDEKSAAYGHIVTGSKLTKVENESVEGLPSMDIMNLIQTKYDKVLPLLMTFKKPLTDRLSLTKQDAINIEVGIECNPRALFLDLRAFYNSWRMLPSDILLNALLICTNNDYQYVSKSSKKTERNMQNDEVFKNLVQWKEKQGLLFIVNGSKKGKMSAFWKSFSDKLVKLSDPSTYNTANYNPLLLEIASYKAFDSLKYEVSIKEIEKELTVAALNVDVIKEILYRSNVWLNIYDEKGVIINENADQPSPSFSLEEEFDAMLDDIATVWDENHDDTYM